jgi:hypothetical protein
MKNLSEIRKTLPCIHTFEIRYDGNPLSLNQYKSLGWRKLKPLVDNLYLEFGLKIKTAKIPTLAWFELHVEHHTRLDNDNVTGTTKPFVDSLVKAQICSNDDSRTYDYLTIRYNKDLPKNQILFKIVGELKHNTHE